MLVALNVEVFPADEAENIEPEVGNAVLLGSFVGFGLNSELVGWVLVAEKAFVLKGVFNDDPPNEVDALLLLLLNREKPV